MKPDMAVKEVLIGKYCHVQVSSVHSHVIHSLPAADAVVVVSVVVIVVVFVCIVIVVVVGLVVVVFVCIVVVVVVVSCHSFLILVAVAFTTSVCCQHDKPFDVIELNYVFHTIVFVCYCCCYFYPFFIFAAILLFL